MRQLQAESLEYVVKNLRTRLDDPNYRTEHVSSLMVQVQRDLRRVKRIGRDIGTVARVEDKATEVRRAGFLIELEHIQQMYESGRTTCHTAEAYARKRAHDAAPSSKTRCRGRARWPPRPGMPAGGPPCSNLFFV